jgi:hypothetical protein
MRTAFVFSKQIQWLQRVNLTGSGAAEKLFLLFMSYLLVRAAMVRLQSPFFVGVEAGFSGGGDSETPMK